MTERYACALCERPLTLAQIAIAESRGRPAIYCSPRCRETARKRRTRARKRAKAQS